MLNGFTRQIIDVDGARINLRRGGNGPALLLLHGFPQTHVHWHAIAPLLKSDFTLVMPDLRGYGDSAGPAPDPDNHHYSKRVMAADMVKLMGALGHERFLLAGHDRGARVAYRLTLDHPQRVTRLASLDTIPTLDVWRRMDSDAAISAFHWPFLAQPAPLPEKLLSADPDFFLQHLLTRWAGRPEALDPQAVAHYAQQFRKPSVRAAMIADYRAGATVDVAQDEADRAAGKRIGCPVFVPWALRYTGTSPLAVWRSWADDVSELCIDCGHFIAEEAPQDCAAALREFFLAGQ